MFRQTPVAPPMSARRKPITELVGDESKGLENDDFEQPRLPSIKLPPVELGPIIKAKIQPPALRDSTLSRQRLIDQLSAATAHRLTLLIAEAGYGKTTLLADFARASGLRTLWYRLDPTDADVITWTNHIVAAARETEPDFGEATLRLLSQIATGGPPTSAFMSSVVSELGDLEPVPTLLILDDFHAVDESPQAVEFVSRLIRDSPPWLAIVVSSRRRPTLEVGRVAASGELAEITTDDLRFSREETDRLFAESYGTPLDDDVLHDLDGRTCGWVASLQLFHGSIRGRSPSAVRALARALSGANSPIYDFLAEEVLGNLSPEIELVLVRSSILRSVSVGQVLALLADRRPRPSMRVANLWIDEADRLGLLSQSSSTSESRHLHPLLRDFLMLRLHQSATEDAVRAMHRRVAESLGHADPLTAAHHFLEAGDEGNAAACLGASVLLTLGSGQSGVASDLVDRMAGVPFDPAVAAIRARRLLEQGQLDEAFNLLAEVDIASSPADVRAVVRHTRLALGWRTLDRELMFKTLQEIHEDPDAPEVLAEIFRIYVDASPLSVRDVPYAALAGRMESMAQRQRDQGHTYYAAISLHNASLAMIAAGRYADARRLGRDALTAFDMVPFDLEKYSTHAILAVASFELGEIEQGEEHLRSALSSGLERGDVLAECALTFAILGNPDQAHRLLLAAAELETQGRSDVAGAALHGFARALLALRDEPIEARRWLEATPDSMPLDMGYVLDRQTLIALSEAVSGSATAAHELTAKAMDVARAKGAGRARARLSILAATTSGDPEALRHALTVAESSGELAMLVTADSIAKALWLIPEVPAPLHRSIAKWTRRWLPVIRRQLDSGGNANAVVAAKLLDEFGDSTDLLRLKAFAKTYRKATRGVSGLGTSLARRVADPLLILDLGRTIASVGDRSFELGSIRRKAAALLMFLATRPGFSANREQTLDELWPDSDPDAASNNLNQALFFLRREIDAWYEDDLSVEYVAFQGELVWLDPTLTKVASVEFAAQARKSIGQPPNTVEAIELLSQYAAPFAPEFEYEDWAIAWRTRVHALFLDLATSTIRTAVELDDLPHARDAALIAIDRDPGANDIERRLVWIYWHLGSRSAAITHYEHLASLESGDGLDVTPLDAIVSSGLP